MTIRNKFGTALDLLTQEEIKGLLDRAMDASKDTWATCTNCKHRIPVKAPDVAATARVLDILSNQALGRPSEAQDNTSQHQAEATIADLEAMTDLELARIAAGHQNPSVLAIPSLSAPARARVKGKRGAQQA